MINLGELELEAREGLPEGYRVRAAALRAALGSELLGGNVYELDAGQSVGPYHYEIGIEEWLIVLSGSPLLRTPEGEERLSAGDVVCFPEGPAGAHKVTNVDRRPLRVLMISTQEEVSACVYPDSAKIGVWPPGKLFREDDAVPYWTGEA
ncbi:MAG TPA: cupin domain-containing protein [Solirubrobacteraceae bacterium]